MGSITLGDILSYTEHLTVAGLLMFAVIGSIRQMWVPFWLYKQTAAEREEYRSELFRLLGLTDRATRALDHTTDTILSMSQSVDERLEARISRLEAQRNVRRRIDKTRENALDDGG